MKKLTNDPSRNVNAVSGMWVRLRKDGSKYDVRYVNARVRRVWSLSQTSQGTAWNVQAKGVQYEDFLNGMRSSSVDLEHGWMLIPDSERMKTVPVPVPTGMDAKTVGGIVAHPSIQTGSVRKNASRAMFSGRCLCPRTRYWKTSSWMMNPRRIHRRFPKCRRR